MSFIVVKKQIHDNKCTTQSFININIFQYKCVSLSQLSCSNSYHLFQGHCRINITDRHEVELVLEFWEKSFDADLKGIQIILHKCLLVGKKRKENRVMFIGALNRNHLKKCCLPLPSAWCLMNKTQDPEIVRG